MRVDLPPPSYPFRQMLQGRREGSEKPVKKRPWDVTLEDPTRGHGPRFFTPALCQHDRGHIGTVFEGLVESSHHYVVGATALAVKHSACSEGDASGSTGKP
ncbi:hypothetical protein E4U16_001387 [Claviceps sp. LM84 group G4]|nr:hypothetical protein E4U33_000747 [Claviceps sp. LM78 group G4]KAG6078877.1 hypothetical protein E4U16_001387 [Claviceps sp. LM84 group G4]